MVESEKDLVRISLRNSYFVSLRKMRRVWAVAGCAVEIA